MTIASISPKELHERQQQGVDVELIDVRTPLEYREVHATFARNIPLDTLDPKSILQQSTSSERQPLYVICKSGSRGARAAQMFVDAGHGHVVNVDGGTEAWASAGLPVTRGKKAISLDRQVRITAGTLVFISALAGMFVHSYWAGIAAAVGAGLAMAGVFDSCMLGMMLAKMPWNQVPCTEGCPAN